MYFDLAPKTKREDLFDFDEEFQKLRSLLLAPRDRAPMIVLKGPRRTGKTSLYKTVLNETGIPYVTLDGAEFADRSKVKREDFLRMVERNLNNAVKERFGEKLLDLLKGIRWIRVSSEPPFIQFEWGRVVMEFDFMDLISRLSEFKRSAIVLDEAQEFRKLVAYRLQGPMAHIYDHVHNVQMIITGSQVGLLRDFLQSDNPAAPLYGRGYAEIRVQRIPEGLAADFLKRGFAQYQVEAGEQVVDLAVKKIDGIMGWLTLFGWRSVEAGRATDEVLEDVLEEARRIELQELGNFLKTRLASRRYERILRTVARFGNVRWETMKRDLDLSEGKRIGDNIFTGLIDELVSADLLRKNDDGTYSVASPILAQALLK